jgi:hypothetical protein
MPLAEHLKDRCNASTVAIAAMANRLVRCLSHEGVGQ